MALARCAALKLSSPGNAVVLNVVVKESSNKTNARSFHVFMMSRKLPTPCTAGVLLTGTKQEFVVVFVFVAQWRLQACVKRTKQSFVSSDFFSL